MTNTTPQDIITWFDAQPDTRDAKQRDIYNRYVQHFSTNNQPVMTMHGFGRFLSSQGFGRVTTRWNHQVHKCYARLDTKPVREVTVLKVICPSCHGKGTINQVTK